MPPGARASLAGVPTVAQFEEYAARYGSEVYTRGHPKIKGEGLRGVESESDGVMGDLGENTGDNVNLAELKSFEDPGGTVDQMQDYNRAVNEEATVEIALQEVGGRVERTVRGVVYVVPTEAAKTAFQKKMRDLRLNRRITVMTLAELVAQSDAIAEDRDA